ncbi:unnamed protein product [Durusdinium trenchii]|uniref:Endonuclease/exonuclease/phosphatase domain-containing protein n=2 Tax=Durusdinium trenchii TaxID=1381693 RepID=A0ABP0LP15_9DINO
MAGQISIEWAWCGLLVLMLTTKDSKTWGVKDTFSTSAVPSGLARKGIRDTLSEAIFGHDNQVRVVSYNVCGFGAGFKDIDPEQVTRVYGQLRTDLSELKADIVCLNEVKRMKLEDPEGNQREDTLEALAEDLEEMEYFFAHANPGYESFGNAILVSKKLQVIHCDSTHLEGGSYVSTPVGKKHIGRGCLAVCVALRPQQKDKSESEAQRFAVLATHLDHISEAERLRQTESILFHRARLSKGLPHLLVGDLNAMKRSDYSAKEWAALETRNSENRWSPPEDSAALAALEAAGYRDLGRLPQTQQTSRWTLRADPPARIDYIYASDDFQHIGTFSAAFVAQAVGSDHLPLVFDVLLKSD